MFRTLKRFLSVPSAAELEATYLNEAVDRYDLEFRERELARGRSAKRRVAGF
jgi:hypothetical protein